MTVSHEADPTRLLSVLPCSRRHGFSARRTEPLPRAGRCRAPAEVALPPGEVASAPSPGSSGTCTPRWETGLRLEKASSW